jgi:methylglutaconyl-CoA hydratase
MNPDLVRYEIRGPSAVLAMHRPEKRNALSRDLVGALYEAFARARFDAAVRCVILTGTGGVFCSGMDLAELQEATRSGAEESPVWEDAVRLGALYELIYSLPKPTIAAVNGTAVAGGAGLAAVCDLAVTVPGAKFGYPEVRRGLVAAMVLPHLLRLVGERTARYLLLTGVLIEAEEALRSGLVNAIAAPDRLLEHALAWGNAVAEGGPSALALTKKLLQRFSSQKAALDETAQASAAPRLGEECRLGLEAFFAKRPAPWASGGGAK